MEENGRKYNIDIMRQGSLERSEDGSYKSEAGLIVLSGARKVLINTGGSWEQAGIESLLREQREFSCDADFDFVICTNNRSEYIGNLNLFPTATHIVGHDIHKEKDFINHKFIHKMPFEIDELISVIPTPGRSMCDLCVVVNNGPMDVTAIVGDMILWEDEINNSFQCDIMPLWDKIELKKHRNKILNKVNRIIPGRGKDFLVQDYHRSAPFIIDEF